MSGNYREFGTRLPGVTYEERPGAYAFLKDSSGRLAIIRTGMGLFLPGGGMEAGEDAVSALKRELFEEIGYQLTSAVPVGKAAQYHWSAYYKKHFLKIGTFFMTEATPPLKPQFQHEHELIWLSPSEAAQKLTQEFQRWAVSEFC